MSSSNNLQTVLNNLISMGETAAGLVIVIMAVMGLICAGHSGLKLYEASQSGEPAGKWIVGVVLGAAMTISGVIIGSASLYFAE